MILMPVCKNTDSKANEDAGATTLVDSSQTRGNAAGFPEPCGSVSSPPIFQREEQSGGDADTWLRT